MGNLELEPISKYRGKGLPRFIEKLLRDPAFVDVRAQVSLRFERDGSTTIVGDVTGPFQEATLEFMRRVRQYTERDTSGKQANQAAANTSEGQASKAPTGNTGSKGDSGG